MHGWTGSSPAAMIPRMSFDENPRSPDRLVNPHKLTTKVKVSVIVGVPVFLLFGGLTLWWLALDFSR